MDVLPRAVTQGEALELVVRVPSERPAATVDVDVAFPPQVTVFSIGEPPAGWRVRVRRAPDGKLRGVRYEGGSIPAGRYADFRFLGTPFESGTAVFPTRQTYADGVTSRWTGPPETGDGAVAPEPAADAPGPAPAVEIAAEGAAPAASGGGIEGAAEEDSGAAIWLGVIAIAIAAGAALLAGFLWSTRPARLPEDDADEAEGPA